MKIMMKVMFRAKISVRLTIDEWIQSYGIKRLPFGQQVRSGVEVEFLNYELEMRYNLATYEDMKGKLEKLGVQKIEYSYSFLFDDHDYEQASLFLLYGLGNSPDAYLEDQGAEFALEVECHNCNLHHKKLLSPLVIDTSFLKERYMVFVDMEHLVVSESMAELLEQWKITGYKLEPVLHKGDQEERQPAYHLIPTNELPAWSDETPRLEIMGKRKCPVCNRRGYMHYPPCYNRADLKGHVQDFNWTREYTVDGNRIKRLPLVSAQFRNLVLEHGLTEDVRYNDTSEEMDWKFMPIPVLDK